MKTKGPAAASGGTIQHSMEHGVDKATVAAHEAVDRAGVAATHAAGAVGAKGDQLNDKGKQIVERATDYVQANPLTSLGMAVAAGYVLSRLLSSR